MLEFEPQKLGLAQITLPEAPLSDINVNVTNSVFKWYQGNLLKFFSEELNKLNQDSEAFFRIKNLHDLVAGSETNEELPHGHEYSIIFEEGLSVIDVFHVRGPYNVGFRYVEDEFDENGESIFGLNELDYLIYKKNGRLVEFDFEVNVGTNEDKELRNMQLPVKVEARGLAYKGRPTDIFMSTSWKREDLYGEDLWRFNNGREVMKKKYRLDKFIWAYGYKTYPDHRTEFKSNYLISPWNP